jgi:hypothetical protein
VRAQPSAPRPLPQGPAAVARSASDAPQSAFDRVLDKAAMFHAGPWVVLACVPIAAVAGLLGGRLPYVWLGMVFAFPALTVLFLVVGMLVFFARAARTPGELKELFRELGPVLLPYLIGGILGAALFRKAFIRRPANPKWNKGATQGFWALAVGAMPLLTVAVSFAAGTLPWDKPDFDPTRPIRPRAAMLTPAAPIAGPAALPPRVLAPRPATPADRARMAQSEQHLRQLASGVLTYRLNAHKLPADLADLFRGMPQILRSPFDPQGPDGYAYLPANITGHRDDNIIFYDRAELQLLGSTQAITNGFQILKLSEADLLARPDVPR